MPAITLRLSDEQHDQVRAWAYVNRRSIQRELEARLFENGTLAEGDHDAGDVESRPSPSRVAPSASAPTCPRAFAHHNYHAGKPCPHCGYPGSRDGKETT